MSTGEKLASYIHDINFTNSPDEVINLAEDCVFDTGGLCAGFGDKEPVTKSGQFASDLIRFVSDRFMPHQT